MIDFYTCTSNTMNTTRILSTEINESNNHAGNYLMIYEWTELPSGKCFIEQVNQLSSDEKVSLVKDKYTVFECETGIPILYDTQ